MTTTPYIGYDNETLAKQPKVKVEEKIKCDKCGEMHVLEGDDNGNTDLLFYRCNGSVYLGAVHGSSVVNTKPDVSGNL